jgi:hypothetical protein
MSILQSVKLSSTVQKGIRCVIGGVEKVGKTTMACLSPRPLHVPLEQGFKPIPCHETPMLTSYYDVIGLLNEAIAAKQKNAFPFGSIVFDSGTALERLIHDAVLQSDPSWAKGNKKALTMESALGGYGKAYTYANELFSGFLYLCDQLAEHGGINIIITCHVFAAKVIDPAYGEYDTWDLLLHSPKNNKTYGKREIITQWADLIGFLHEPLFILKGDDKSNFQQGVSANKGRILGIERTPGYVAGNRFGMKGEIAIPREKAWNYLAQAIHAACGLDVFNREI